MADVMFVAEEIDEENPLYFAFEYLSQDFDCELVSFKPIECVKQIENVFELQKMNPKMIITNSFAALASSKSIPTVFYACSSNGNPFTTMDVGLRRQLQVRPEVEIFCSSMYLAKFMYTNYQLRAKIQYPYIRYKDNNSHKEEVVYNTMTPTIQNIIDEMPNERFRQYECLADLQFAKLYIHTPPYDEATNTRIPTAASWGVPTITTNRGCLTELMSAWDTLFPIDANTKQWIQGAKIAMRDNNNNSENVKNNSKKWSNLDALANKVKQSSQQRALQKGLSHIPDVNDAKNVKASILAARETQAITKRYHKPIQQQPPEQPRPGMPTPPVVIFSQDKYVRPSATKLLAPDWFQEPNDVDVSIIIPMYKSSKEITEQIKNWPKNELTTEIIYVNDACPQHSYTSVLDAWKDKADQPIGKIILLSNRSGCSTAYNEGTKFAKGKYLVFLNANVTVTPGWLMPMINAMRDNIGIVGNLHQKDNEITSAGMQWMWDSKTFEHVGRNVYDGARLSRIMNVAEAPPASERDMVSGRCMLTTKNIFDMVGGFDIAYRIKGWEDADINMKIKDKGYKVYYQPNSVVVHNKSQDVTHSFLAANARTFAEKWVDNNKVASLTGKK